MTLPPSFLRRTVGAAGLATLILATATAAPAHAGPFSGLEGDWSGNGTVLVASGAKENIRCRASYKVDTGGDSLRQVLRCASDSYRFDLISNVRAQGASLSGNWNESNRNINGTIEGRATVGQFQALVSANGFAASLSMQTKGNKQTISIESKNTDLQGVNITLSR